MKIRLIYPYWKKISRQTEFHLPPYGPVSFAATLPEDVDVEFIDDNLDNWDYETDADLICLSIMLTCQLPKGMEIAAQYRKMGKTVMCGGIACMLHSDEVAPQVDCLFLGEAEGRMTQVISDFRNNKLKPVYNYLGDHPDINLVGPAKRDILNHDNYNYRGVQMLDLISASRGCKFNCAPCCTGFLGGKVFRPRPVEKVIEELHGIKNNRVFMVDNSLSQDKEWLKDLFREMIPLKKKWVSHPVMYDPEVLDLAAQAGCWYVYQAVFDTSDVIRERIKMLKDHGIGIEGTILLGTDDHDEDYIKRLVDFLLEMELDIAEFTILTPFPQSPLRAQLEKENRILHNDWSKYTTEEVVFQPKQMTGESLQNMYKYAWDTFYADNGHQIQMGELFKRVIRREMDDGTYKRYNPKKAKFRRNFKNA
ncbi:MAG: radical SAM protein [Desulfotalea sp.]